jgi:hypothetical protein
MLSFADPRWPRLTAGYRIPVDLRPLLRRLESGSDTGRAWEDLWRELHHQGDVGNGSYVAVPHLVRIHRERGVPDWNTYALVATIELARARGSNPEVPGTDRVSYEQALQDLAGLGLRELSTAKDPETVRAILAVLAIVHGVRTYGRILAEFSEDEVLELERRAFGDSPRNRNPPSPGSVNP